MPDTALPLVSIVIPVYNGVNFICDAVDSALAQTYPQCEVIVVDDGSTDDTHYLLTTRYGNCIHVLRQSNQGVSAARNAGIQAAQGKLIQFCDADDLLRSEKVARSVAVFQERPEIVFLYTWCDLVAADGRTLLPGAPRVPLPSGDVFCDLLNGPQGNFVITSSVMARRPALLQTDGFNPQIPVAQDWDMWLKLASRAPAVGLNEALVLYRELPGSLSADPERLTRDRLTVVQMARHYHGRERCLDDPAYDQFEAGRHHQLAVVLWKKGRRAEARQSFRAAVRLDPSPVRQLLIGLSYVLPAQLALPLVGAAIRIRERFFPR
jgi:glycosyltransferase involved in cell wall biosynthesis